jgi:glycosyltransferase involved in cell wall biosynthesis
VRNGASLPAAAAVIVRARRGAAAQRLFQAFYGKCDVIAVPNLAIGQKMVDKIGVPAEKIGLMPRGINTTLYTPARRSDAFRLAQLNASRDDVVVLWAGRVVKEKGALLFADAGRLLFEVVMQCDEK